MKGFALTVLALAAAVAILAPRTDRASGRKPAPASVAAPAAQRVQSLSGGGAMILQREDDGHFYADAQVDDRDYRMLVDTGASVVALTGKDAQAMGLQWDPADLSPIVRGAGGPVMGVATKIDDMTVGGFEARDVDAVSIPDGWPISLLGQSFLRQVRNVDISEDKLTLSD